MSSPSDRFECHWQPSRLLLTAYLAVQALALLAILSLDVSGVVVWLGVLTCMFHGLWVVPRTILLTHDTAFTALRRDARGWQIYSERAGWRDVQVCNDSVVLPLIVILRVRLLVDGKARFPTRSICIPRDALAPDSHRRLRVRLKFSRRGLPAPE